MQRRLVWLLQLAWVQSSSKPLCLKVARRVETSDFGIMMLELELCIQWVFVGYSVDPVSTVLVSKSTSSKDFWFSPRRSGFDSRCRNQILPVNFTQNVTGWCFNLRGAKGDCSPFINLVLYNFVLRFAILSMKKDFCRILRVSTSSFFSYLFLFFTNSYAFGFYFILRLSPLEKIS